MTTEAHAILKVEVEGERKVDALNKKLQGIGKGAFKDLGIGDIDKQMDRAAARVNVRVKSMKQALADVSSVPSTPAKAAFTGFGDTSARVAANREYARKKQELHANAQAQARLNAVPKYDYSKWKTKDDANTQAEVARLASVVDPGRGPSRSLFTNLKAWGATFAEKTKGLDHQSVGRGFGKAAHAGIEKAWGMAPFGSYNQWTGLEYAVAKPMTAFSRLGGLLGNIAGPLGGVVGGIAGLGAGIAGVGVAAFGAIGFFVTLKQTLSAVAKGGEAAKRALDRHYEAEKANTTDKRQGLGEHIARGIGLGENVEDARKKISDIRDTIAGVASGDGKTAANEGAAKIGITPAFLKQFEKQEKRPFDAMDAIVKARRYIDAAKPDIETRGGVTTIHAGRGGKDKAKRTKDVEDTLGPDAAKVAVNKTLAQMEAAKKAANDLYEKPDLKAASSLQGNLDLLGEKFGLLGERITNRLIPPIDNLITNVLSKFDGDAGKQAANTVAKMLTDMVGKVGELVKSTTPGDIEKMASTVASAFTTITGAGVTFATGLKKIGDALGWTKIEPPQKPEAEKTWGDKIGDNGIVKLLKALDRATAIPLPWGADNVKPRGAADKEQYGPNLSEAAGKIQDGGQKVESDATKMAETSATLSTFASTLPEKGTAFGDNAKTGLVSAGSPAGSAMAAALIAGLSGFKIPVDVAGAKAAIGTLRVGGDVPEKRVTAN